MKLLRCIILVLPLCAIVGCSTIKDAHRAYLLDRAMTVGAEELVEYVRYVSRDK